LYVRVQCTVPIATTTTTAAAAAAAAEVYVSTMEITPMLNNVSQWIDDNKHYFVPPVCNKLM